MMKFTVSKDALLSHLQVAKQVISSKNVLPVLDNFLLEVSEGTLTITASDNETTLVLSMELMENEGDGRIAVNAKMLVDALKEMNEQPIRFEVNMDSLEVCVKYQNGEFNLMGADAEEFVTCPELANDAHTFTIDAHELLPGIKNVLFAVANDELRPVMNGICFDVLDDTLTLVASDGTLLVRRRVELPNTAEKGCFILPKKPASVLCNILNKHQSEVCIESDSKNIRFMVDGITLSCRMIEGRYPNYNSVIPTDNPYRMTVNRAALISALRRVSVFANQANNLVKMEASMGGAVLSCIDVDFSTSSKETVGCEYDGNNLTIGYKSTLLIDILNNLASDEVTFDLKDASRATLLKPVDDNLDLVMLLMPMQINY